MWVNLLSLRFPACYDWYTYVSMYVCAFFFANPNLVFFWLSETQLPWWPITHMFVYILILMHCTYVCMYVRYCWYFYGNNTFILKHFYLLLNFLVHMYKCIYFILLTLKWKQKTIVAWKRNRTILVKTQKLKVNRNEETKEQWITFFLLKLSSML